MFGLGVSEVTQMIEKAFSAKKSAIIEEIRSLVTKEFTDVFIKYKKASEERAEEVLRVAQKTKSLADDSAGNALLRIAKAQEEQSKVQSEILLALHGLSKAFLAAVTIETEAEPVSELKTPSKRKKK